MNTYSKIVINFDEHSDLEQKNSLDQLMLQSWNCAGIEDAVLEEKELSALLGDKAVTGGPLPSDVIDSLEIYCQSLQDKTSSYFFYGEESFSDALSARDNLHQHFPQISKVQLHQCQEESWLDKWKEHYKPIEIDKEFRVLPSWFDALENKTTYTIKIDPGQAFGTGSHESTKLCLKLLKENFVQTDNLSVMDFGCGSGILGLATIILNPEAKVTLFDIDPAAYENIAVNTTLNNINSSQVELVPAGLDLVAPWSETKYDLVFANILLPILLDKAHLLSSLVKTEGHLLISGIMIDQWEDLSIELSKYGHWVVVAQADLNSWLSILVKKIIQ